MVWTKDLLTGKIHFLTQNFEEFFECSMDTLVANPQLLQSCIHPDDQPFVEIFSKTLLSQNNEDMEYRIVGCKGSIRWARERRQLVKNEVGEIIRLDVVLEDISQRKAVELDLETSELAFRSIFFKSPQPMWVYDLETLDFLMVNEAAVSFYGYTHDEFFRMSIRQIRPKEDVAELLEAIKNQNFDNHQHKIWRHIKKDGTLVYVRIRSCPLFYRGRNCRVVLAFDETRRVEAEQKTEKAYSYLQKFQEAISSANFLALLDREGKFTFLNENLTQALGYKPQELIGKSWTGVLARSNGAHSDKKLWNKILEGSNWKGEQIFLGQKGRKLFTHCSLIPLATADGHAELVILVAQDIGLIKESEKKSRQMAIRLHGILESVTDAIVVLDKKWCITNLNQSAEHLLEAKSAHLLEKVFWETIPAEEGVKLYAFLRKAKKKNVTVRFEEYFPPKSSWFDISVYPTKDGLTLVFRDISQRRQEEIDNKKLVNHL